MKHMRGKLIAALAMGAGYVLGTKAGRERYEKISRTARDAWQDPRVQEKVHTVEEVAKEKAQSTAENLRDVARSTADVVSEKVGGHKQSTDPMAPRPADGAATIGTDTTY